MRALDLTGQSFGRLTVIRRAENTSSGRTRWLCRCDCGNKCTPWTLTLRNGTCTSCGCYNRELVNKLTSSHKMSSSREYNIWNRMKQRTTNSNYPEYEYYGGRGITVCPEWINSFETFISDMGKSPSPTHSVDRIDPNGPYSLANCRWATSLEQGENRRDNFYIKYNGTTLHLAAWARKLKINYGTLRSRLQDYGWSVKRAFTTPVTKNRRIA